MLTRQDLRYLGPSAIVKTDSVLVIFNETLKQAKHGIKLHENNHFFEKI